MSKTAFLSLLAALTIGRAASATSYTIAFTPVYSYNDPSFAASGSFLYDAATGFSNFVVTWDGTSFDLTARRTALMVWDSWTPVRRGPPVRRPPSRC